MPSQYGPQFRQQKDVYAGIGGECLVKAEMAGFIPEVALFQKLEGLGLRVKHVCPRDEPIYSVHNEVCVA